jgi:predicted SprT family Zn-dependent metalloprotease
MFPLRMNARLTTSLFAVKRLKTTAGRCSFIRRPGTEERIARIEIAIKVVDSEARLRETLLHEMCHAAAWCLDGVSRPPHGPHFRAWGARAMRIFPTISVTTCHQFEIAPGRFRYECTSNCGFPAITRHSRSIDLQTARCGWCASELRLQRLNTDGTPAKTREPTQFSLFTKTRFAEVKCSIPGATHAQVMSRLAALWRDEKAAAVPLPRVDTENLGELVAQLNITDEH